MKRFTLVFLTCLLAFTVATSVEAKKKKKSFDTTIYAGKSPEEAMSALVAEARESVKAESWEKIAIARVLLLGGKEAAGKALLDEVASSADGSDFIRIGRVYHEAGDWPAAKAAFDRVVELEPKDADWLAEIGGHYNLAGDRERAEELFARSFALEPNNWRNMLKAAGSYTGVRPD